MNEQQKAVVPPQTTASNQPHTFGLPTLSEEERDELQALLELYANMNDKEKQQAFKENYQKFARAFMYLGAGKLSLKEEVKQKLRVYVIKKRTQKENEFIKKIMRLSKYDCAYVDWGNHLVVGEVSVQQNKDGKAQVKFIGKYYIVQKEKYPNAYEYVKTKFDNAKDDENKSFL